GHRLDRRSLQFGFQLHAILLRLSQLEESDEGCPLLLLPLEVVDPVKEVEILFPHGRALVLSSQQDVRRSSRFRRKCRSQAVDLAGRLTMGARLYCHPRPVLSYETG